MSEYVAKPNKTANENMDNLDWAGTATLGTDVIEPNGSKRNTGHVDAEEPPYESFNWFWRVVSLAVAWIASWKIRAFSALDDGANSTVGLAEGHVFILGKASGPTAAGTTVWSRNSSVNILDIATDGVTVYITDNQTVRGIARSNGSNVSASSSLGAAIHQLYTDGYVVYVGTANNGSGNELHFLDPSDLSSFATGHNPNADIDAIGANGKYFAYAVNGTTVAQLWQWSSGTPSLISSGISHGAQVNCVALDWGYLFLAGARGTGSNDIRAFDFAATGIWSVQLAGTGTSNVRDICCDGEYVYAVGDVLTDTLVYNVWCLSRADGAVIWRAALDGGNDMQGCDVDQRYLYCVSDAGEFFCLDKRNGAIMWTKSGMGASASDGAVCCDGEDVYVCGDLVSSDGAWRLAVGRHSTMFIRADVEDPNRRPFANAMVPLE